uniref:Uncharacterized protein n=1 Tax=Aegilops tauschii subsp. strangulata TaxID=200361 RepID=A0A453RZA5_AEGTS
MVTGLRRVSWEKVDVSFHTSMRSFAAHSIIQVPCRPSLTLALWKIKIMTKSSLIFSLSSQVKYAFMNEGADVIQHIIDHFQL